jgi:hypothetical protein
MGQRATELTPFSPLRVRERVGTWKGLGVGRKKSRSAPLEIAESEHLLATQKELTCERIFKGGKEGNTCVFGGMEKGDLYNSNKLSHIRNQRALRQNIQISVSFFIVFPFSPFGHLLSPVLCLVSFSQLTRQMHVCYVINLFWHVCGRNIFIFIFDFIRQEMAGKKWKWKNVWIN